MSSISGLISRLKQSGGNAECENIVQEHAQFDGMESVCAEYVAPACHYNEDTLLNKGGELVQILKIEDYVRCAADTSLRDVIRKVITDVGDGSIAFWIYTVREKKEFELEWRKTGDFSDSLHEVHTSIMGAQHETYTNTVYIAVVTSHLPEGMEGIANALWWRRVKKRHKNYLASKAERLAKTTSTMIDALSGFAVSKLALLECEDGRWRSEPLEFLSYIVTLKRKECYLEMCDNAHTITGGHDIRVGFNAFKVTDVSGSRYGAILGVKSYIGDSLESTDTCLQQACEFIIVEVLRFVESKEVKKVYSRQAELLEISGDQGLAEVSHLADIMAVGDTFGECCETKVTCLVIGNTLALLKQGLHTMVNAFSAIGALVVRMDIAMEDCFWANMPGNFRYVLGMKGGLVSLACNFAMLHEFPSGSIKGGRWSEAITMFFSTVGLPYFFSFHTSNKGHTLCLGPQDSYMTLLLNFMLSESRRLNVKSVVFDYSGKSVIYSFAIKGEYHRIDSRPERVSQSFNPFHVKDTKANRAMAVETVCRMVSPFSHPTDTVREAVSEAVGSIFSLPMESRTPEKISESMRVLGGKIGNWVDGGQFAHLITSSTNIGWGAEFLAINAGMLINKMECLSVVLYYMLNVLERHLDGSPVILVIYEAWVLDMVFYTEEEFDDWMERLERLNVVVVLASENVRAISTSRVIRYVNKHTETRIFMPNFVIGSKQHSRLFGLTQEELDVMLQISQKEGHFFVKQEGRSVVLSLNLTSRKRRVLSADRDTIRIMYESVAEKGKDWLEEFHAKCAALEAQ